MAIPTGTPTSSSTISALVTAAYDQYVRMALRSIPVMRSLADVKPVQQAMPGSSVVFSIYSDLAQATSLMLLTVVASEGMCVANGDRDGEQAMVTGMAIVTAMVQRARSCAKSG